MGIMHLRAQMVSRRHLVVAETKEALAVLAVDADVDVGEVEAAEEEPAMLGRCTSQWTFRRPNFASANCICTLCIKDLLTVLKKPR
jgi:hypothetical protein